MAHPHPISFYNNLFFILTIWIILLKTSLLRPTPLLEKCVVTPRLEQNEAQIWARCIGKALHRPPHLVFCCFLSPLLLPSSHTSHSPSIMYFLSFLSLFYFCFFLPHLATYGIFVSQPAMEPEPPAVQVQGLNHWTSREAPHVLPDPVLRLCCCLSLHTSSTLWPFPSRLKHNSFHSFHSTPPPHPTVFMISVIKHVDWKKKKDAQPQSWELCFIQWTFWGLKPGQKSLR